MLSLACYSSRPGVRPKLEPSKFPSAETCAKMPRNYYEMSNEALLILSAGPQGEHGARTERMIREVMHVDQVSWPEAYASVKEMSKEFRGPLWSMSKMPYQTGVVVSLVAGVASIPLVFHKPAAIWFSGEIPPDDVVTCMNTGTWTWDWMEPGLGTISFVLLTLQFARNQTRNIWATRHFAGPYTSFLKSYRARLLVEKYPQYHYKIVSDFSASAPSLGERVIAQYHAHNR
jgi:hypothetical protein